MTSYTPERKWRIFDDFIFSKIDNFIRDKDKTQPIRTFENSFLNSNDIILIDNNWSVWWKVTFAFEG